jgi:predicted ATPase
MLSQSCIKIRVEIKNLIVRAKNYIHIRTSSNSNNSFSSELSASTSTEFAGNNNAMLEKYNHLISTKAITYDENQLDVVLKLNDFYSSVNKNHFEPKEKYRYLFDSILQRLKKKQNAKNSVYKRGIYLYGGVGVFFLAYFNEIIK